ATLRGNRAGDDSPCRAGHELRSSYRCDSICRAAPGTAAVARARPPEARAPILPSRVRARSAASCRFLGRLKSPLQMHQQQRYGRRRDPRDARSLPDGFGAVAIQLLLYLHRQALDAAVIEIDRQREPLELAPARNFLALALDVALVLDLDLELLGDFGWCRRLAHEVGVAHFRPFQNLYGWPLFLRASAHNHS